MNFKADSIAAPDFSAIINWYSAGEHLFWAISMDRRAMVSQDLRVRFVINSGRDAAVRRLERFNCYLVLVRCSHRVGEAGKLG